MKLKITKLDYGPIRVEVSYDTAKKPLELVRLLSRVHDLQKPFDLRP